MAETTPRNTNQQGINDAAASAAGLSPLVGMRSEDVRSAFTATLRQLIKQPLVATKHGAGFAGKLVDVLGGDSDYILGKRDRRFADEQWQENSRYQRMLQAYLALDESLREWLDDLELEGLDEQRARFVVDLISDCVAPTNNLLTNPAALRKVRETRGQSLLRGASNLIDDMRHNHGMPAQVDKSQFRVGENLANLPGAVVFRNDFLELIQYNPNTASVYQRPLMVVPPQINKYYVFDLAPEKSLFRFFVSQGIQLFAVSWRNPGPEQRDWGMDDYVAALHEAIDAVRDITGREDVNLMGACSGGITASIFSGYMDAIGGSAINSLTLLVCVLSQRREDSDMTAFASSSGIEAARRTSQKKGVLDGKELARVFNWMRPNDLIWNYVVNNYYLGNSPPAFDILYWNNDTTCLPAALHSDFLDQLENNPLVTPGGLTVGDVPIDLGSLDCDKYLVAGTTDHITPWHACYRSTQFLGGDIRFVLSNSGHIQALVNPPGNPRATYFVSDDLPESHEQWLQSAEQHSGTWWTDWAEWIQQRSGKRNKARKRLGNRKYQPMEAAPGTYVYD